MLPLWAYPTAYGLSFPSDLLLHPIIPTCQPRLRPLRYWLLIASLSRHSTSCPLIGRLLDGTTLSLFPSRLHSHLCIIYKTLCNTMERPVLSWSIPLAHSSAIHS